MTEHRFTWIRWVALVAAVGVLVVFLHAQQRSVQVSYARSPAGSGIKEGSAGELSGAKVPSVAQMTAMVKAAAVVRLPGSIARWDDAKVRAAIGSAPTRILVAPPGLSQADQDKVGDVENATIRIVGTKVSGGIYAVSGSTAADWEPQFASDDVTNLLLTLIAGLADKPIPTNLSGPARGNASVAEAQKLVVNRITGSTAFPGGSAVTAMLPPQADVERYGPALSKLYPNTPVVVMYGSWIEYDGPDAADFADVASASFYGQFDDRLSRYAYPQQDVLNAYLERVTDVRYAGLFDRPLPYRPFDPLRVTLPVLPWLFAACVLVFLVLSVRSLRRPRPRYGAPARLSMLTALAVEISAFTDRTSNPALARGFTALRAAGEALAEDLPEQHVSSLLDTAESDLDECAKRLPYRGFRPAEYLA